MTFRGRPGLPMGTMVTAGTCETKTLSLSPIYEPQTQNEVTDSSPTTSEMSLGQ